MHPFSFVINLLCFQCNNSTENKNWPVISQKYSFIIFLNANISVVYCMVNFSQKNQEAS